MTNNAEDPHSQEDIKNFPSLESLQVLVVDDNDDSLVLTTFILESSGFQVTTAASAAQAFETIKQLKFDILICDIAMPEVDGYALIRTVRESKLLGQQEIPAIALTALGSEESRNLAFMSGFQSYVNKPVDSKILLAEIRRVMSENQKNST
ncbi:MAG: response regulator [Mojavia pulchra JT2-VF2]|uniref:Response regulator n=1 Tax=Mojavia pulchra JT2-VF2 TaxID=287848 RepID=A0A951PTI9_9NOST|nr:response regulator [Mojavia pulchra JT2-VF2]